ncbi:MAG: hypothetical protein JEZ06_23520 [Anaerolineaceae bacterium]|nr:hypothetical protein [Anaerolineaceae bacterium]
MGQKKKYLELSTIPKLFRYLLLFLLFAFLIFLVYSFIPEVMGIDWTKHFGPAVDDLLKGTNPYSDDQFMIAPWIFFLFLPLRFLPTSLAVAIIRTLSFSTYAFVAYRLGAKPLSMLLIMISPQIMHTLINANIDWLAFLGFILPPQIGIFFVALKPQVGFALAIYWAFEAYQQKTLIKTFAPFIVVLVLSFVFFGLWPFNFNLVQEAYNASAWPLSLPFGIVLLVKALKDKEIRIAQAISPLLSPHVMFYSWATFLFALISNPFYLLLAVASSWLLVGFTIF